MRAQQARLVARAEQLYGVCRVSLQAVSQQAYMTGTLILSRDDQVCPSPAEAAWLCLSQLHLHSKAFVCLW